MFGDAYFYTPNVRDYGVQHQGQEKLKGTIFESTHGISKYLSQNSSLIYITNPEQLDSLFFVHGNTYGRDGSLVVKNTSSMEEYKNQAIESKIRSYGKEVPLVNLNGQTGETETIISGDVVTYKWYKSGYWDPYFSWKYHNAQSGTEKFSIFNELENVYKKVIEIIEELMNEIKWWDEE